MVEIASQVISLAHDATVGDRAGFANRRAIPPFAALRAFEAVGRLGGIRRAAQWLSLDHAVISRHLRGLELWTGVRLIDREHGGGRLTPEGAQYHARIALALSDIVNATADLMRCNDEARLKLWCVPGLASQWLLSRLGDFRLSHPDIDIEFHPTDVAPDFGRHDADADLRYLTFNKQKQILPGVQVLEIARPPVFPVASPQLLARLRHMAEPADLLSAPLLHEDSDEEWRVWFNANGFDPGPRVLGPRLWHAHLTLDAARRGEGLALANPFLLGDDIQAGRLAPVLVGRPVPLGSYLLFARRDRWESPAVIKFRSWLLMRTKSVQNAA